MATREEMIESARLLRESAATLGTVDYNRDNYDRLDIARAAAAIAKLEAAAADVTRADLARPRS